MSSKYIALLVMMPLLFGGCAMYQKVNRQESCERIIKDYGRMIRWQEADKAAIVYVDIAQRAAFDKTAEGLRRRGISMVDYRIISSQCLVEKKQAIATLEFDYFILPDNRLKTVTDRQSWIYREENPLEPDAGEGWKLTTPLPDFK